MRKENAEEATYKSLARVCLMAGNISLSFFYFGYTVIYYAAIPAETVNRLYHIEIDVSTAEGLLNGAVSIGGLLGSFLSKFVLDHFSRRNGIIFLNICSLALGILIFIPNFYSFLFLRLMQGVCVGAFTSVSPLYIKQISPLEISGVMGNFSQLSLTLGVSFGQFLSYLLKKWTGDESGEQFWMVVFGFSLIILLVQILVLLFVFPYETPKYHLVNNEKKECEDLIRLIYKDEYFEQIYQTKLSEVSSNQSEVRQEVIPAALVVAGLLISLQQLSGVNGMVLYASDIASKSFKGEMIILFPMLLNLIILAFICLSFLLAHKMGSKTMIVGGFAVAALANSVTATGYARGGESWSNQAILFGIVIFAMAYGASLGPVGWAYLPEIVPPSAMPCIVACNWLSYTLVATFFPIISQHLLNGNPSLIFLFFAASCAFAVAFNWKFMVQTKDRLQGQINQQFKSVKLC